MKKLIALTMVLILVISTMVAATSVSAAAQPSQNDQTKSNVLFSWADIKAAHDAGTFGELVTGVWGSTCSYNTEDNTIRFTRDFWPYVKITAQTDKLDMTKANWLRGKTLEFEVIPISSSSNNFLLCMHPYSIDPVDSNNNNNNNTGISIWWFGNTKAVSSNNKNVASNDLSHTVAEQTLTLTPGTPQRFRIVETAEKQIHYIYDATSETWVAIDEGHAVSNIQVNQGGVMMAARAGDVWAVSDFIVYENDDAEFYGVQETALYDTNGDTTPDSFDVRFISQVDASAVANYTEIGFEVSATFETNGVVAPKRYDTNCYNTLLASNKAGNVTCVTAPEGKYFCALAIEGIPTSAGTVTFTVKPYVIENGIYVYGAAYDVVYNAATATFVSAAISG